MKWKSFPLKPVAKHDDKVELKSKSLKKSNKLLFNTKSGIEFAAVYTNFVWKICVVVKKNLILKIFSMKIVENLSIWSCGKNHWSNISANYFKILFRNEKKKSGSCEQKIEGFVSFPSTLLEENYLIFSLFISANHLILFAQSSTQAAIDVNLNLDWTFSFGPNAHSCLHIFPNYFLAYALFILVMFADKVVMLKFKYLWALSQSCSLFFTLFLFRLHIKL